MKASIWKWLILLVVAAGSVYLVMPEATRRVFRAVVAELRSFRTGGGEKRGEAEPAKSAARVQPVPAPAKDGELPFYYEVPEVGTTPVAESAEDRTLRLQRDGQAAFLYGDYGRALSLWEEWLSLETNNPQAFMLVGDARQRLGDLEQAEIQYARSLDLDPGQVSLAMRRASLLSKLGRSPEAVASLNLYARLFPDDEQVMLAQAEWLWRENRSSEAIPLLRRLLERAPDNPEARALLLQLPIDAEEFKLHLDQLVAFATGPDRQYALGQLIWTHDLLSLPKTDVLAQWVGTLAEQSREERMVALFNSLKPRTEPVEETCEAGKLSEAWMIKNGEFLPRDDGGGLRSDSLHTEAYLRLSGSEQLRDAFVEASIGEVAGGVWLFLRRTADHFIRFGFDESGSLHLQIWNHGQMVASQNKPWILKEGQTRLRLEIHGMGVMGFVDGEPAFKSSLGIPFGYGLGWTGVGAFHSERGKAQVVIARISAGPVLPRLAMIPPLRTEADVDAVLAQLRSESRAFTDVAPQGYQAGPDGEWTDPGGPGGKLLQLFARFARLRLRPVVEVASPQAISASSLVAEAARRNLDGFVLRFEKMPETAWLDALRKELAGSGLDVLALAMDAAAGAGKMAGLGEGRTIFMANPEGADFRIVPWANPDGVHNPLASLPANQAIGVILDVPSAAEPVKAKAKSNQTDEPKIQAQPPTGPEGAPAPPDEIPPGKLADVVL